MLFQKSVVLATSLFALAVCPSRAAIADNFSDNVTGPEWTQVLDDGSVLNLAEQNQRLEVLASNPLLSTTDAIYLSNGTSGFRLSTSANFEIAIDYNFATVNGSSAASGNALALVFGVGRDLDGTDSAAIGFGYVKVGSSIFSTLTEAHRIDDVQTANPLGFGTTSGTFVISYDAAGDDLTLGVGATTYTLNDTVRAVWGASDLLVSFGARGNGFSTASGNATLDNFEVRSGNVVPESASVALLALGGTALVSRRRRMG